MTVKRSGDLYSSDVQCLLRPNYVVSAYIIPKTDQKKKHRERESERERAEKENLSTHLTRAYSIDTMEKATHREKGEIP